jgi:hypothetical protein
MIRRYRRRQIAPPEDPKTWPRPVPHRDPGRQQHVIRDLVVRSASSAGSAGHLPGGLSKASTGSTCGAWTHAAGTRHRDGHLRRPNLPRATSAYGLERHRQGLPPSAAAVRDRDHGAQNVDSSTTTSGRLPADHRSRARHERSGAITSRSREHFRILPPPFLRWAEGALVNDISSATVSSGSGSRYG